MENKCANSAPRTAGRPTTHYYRLKPVVEIEQVIRDNAWQAITRLVAHFNDKIPPMYWDEAAANELIGVTDDNLAAVLQALELATHRASDGDDVFSAALNLHAGRCAELFENLDRALQHSDFVSAIDIDPDLRHKDSAHNVMAAQIDRYYYELEPNKKRPNWLSVGLTGVSAPTLRQKIRPLAKLRRAGPTRVWVSVDPGNIGGVMKQITIIARRKSGRPLYLKVLGHSPIPYNKMNLRSAIEDAALVGARLEVEFSVSQPLERYDPATDPIETTTPHQLKRKPQKGKRRSGPLTSAELYHQSFHRLLEAHGWSYDGEKWTDRNGVRWPDHIPTALAALTGDEIPGAKGPINEAESNSNIHRINERNEEASSAPEDVEGNTMLTNLNTQVPEPRYVTMLEVRIPRRAEVIDTGDERLRIVRQWKELVS